MECSRNVMAANHRVLISGLVTTAEMRRVVSDALSVFAEGDVRIVARLSTISVDENWSPDVVIVCQNRPDEFAAADVHGLFARFPLARWVCCFGLWCESDGRNRDAWPVGVRVPARLAKTRFKRELDVLNGIRKALPLTAGREEAFEFDYAVGVQPSGRPASPPTSRNQKPGLFEKPGFSTAVVSPDRELRRSFADRLRRLGSAIGRAAETADVVLWDADPWDDSAAARLCRLRDANPAAVIVALMGLETPGDDRAVTAAGGSAVLGKLADSQRLAATIRQCLPQS
ncbi:MAG: hypothetical protein ACE5KM_01075 [Planctomycetaceae bacterium]